jgi:hypothetical protein
MDLGIWDGILMIFFGVYFGLQGFGVIRVSKLKKDDPKLKAWHAKWGKWLKIISPILIVLGAVKLVMALVF